VLLITLSIVLHPRYRTTYFTCAKWPVHWISDAEALARKIWTEDYKKVAPSSTEDTTQEAEQSGLNDVSFRPVLLLFFFFSFLSIVYSVSLRPSSTSAVSKKNLSLQMLLKSG
jgi:hypothetical protein